MKIRLPLNVKGMQVDDIETWPEVDICDSQDCGALATGLYHWVDGPVVYCPHCGAWMLQVAETLGVHVHVEPITLPVPATTTRGIDVDGLT